MNYVKVWRGGLSLWLVLTLSVAVVPGIFAQGSGLQLGLGKISGIGLGSQIQGFFGLSVSGPADITSVTFSMDGKEMGTVNQAPFGFQFHTDSYSPGQHRFSATARTAGGQVLTSNPVNAEIVSFSSGWSSVVRLLWPLFLVILFGLLAAFAIPVLSSRRSRRYEPGAARQYGLAGGTVCSRCGRPYALSIFGPNLIVGRLARCPYCGKWSLARRFSQADLRAAEEAEVQDQPTLRGVTAEERFRRQIEDARLSG